MTLLHTLERIAHIPRPQAIDLLRGRHVRVDGQVRVQPAQRVRPGQRLEIGEVASTSRRGKGRLDTPAARAPKVQPPKSQQKEAAPLPPIASEIEVVYQDAHILVVNKPAGLTTVRHADEVAEKGRKSKFLPPTLVDLLHRVLPPHQRRGRIRAVHRLDRDTSGLVVLARTAEAESHLGKQFRAHTTERRYLALVRGIAKEERIDSYLVRDRGDGRRGSGSAEEGQQAITNVRVLESLGHFSLVECRLETGRTHQVRIHLGERGTPLCGERIYDRPLHGKPLPDESGADRPMLHGAVLAIDHPATGRRMSWESELPRDMASVLRQVCHRR